MVHFKMTSINVELRSRLCVNRSPHTQRSTNTYRLKAANVKWVNTFYYYPVLIYTYVCQVWNKNKRVIDFCVETTNITTKIYSGLPCMVSCVWYLMSCMVSRNLHEQFQYNLCIKFLQTVKYRKTYLYSVGLI